MISVYWGLALVAVVSFVLTIVLVPFSIVIARKFGAIDEPNSRRVHQVATPRMGGVALFGGMMGSLALAWIFHKTGIAPELDFPDNLNTGLIALSIVLIFLVGVVDDIKQIRARTKFLGQIVVACVAVLGGVLLTDIHSGQAGFTLAFGIWAYPITVLYLVAFANIVNLIDGLDGLAAGVAAIAGSAFLILSCQLHIWATATMAVALVASCLAFLKFNFHPAKLFMGDSGSLTLGFILGMVSLMGTMRVSSVTSLAVPVVIAAIPVLDTFAAIIRRKRKGVSIGTPDKEHIHHSLLKLGFSQRRVVLTIYAICAIFAASGIAIAGTPLAVRVGVLVVDFAIAVVLVWKLGLFGKVMGRYYPDGKPRNLAATIAEMKAHSERQNQESLRSDARASASLGSEKKFRILVMCEHFSPGVDACAKRMTVMVDHLIDCGHDVHVLASETSLAEANDDYEVPSHVHFFPTFKMENKSVVNRLRNNWSEVSGSKMVAKELGRFDIVIVTSPPLMLTISGISVASRMRAKLVFDVRDIWPDVAYEMGSFSESSIFGRVFTFLSNRAYKKASIITTVSKSKAAKLRTKLAPLDAAKIRLVPNGLDVSFLDQVERDDLIEKYELDENPPVVYVGNLGLAQGLSTLLMIAKQRPNIRFLLFGSGAEERLLAQIIDEEELNNVELCGRTDVQGVFTILTHARFAYVSLKNSNMVDSVPTKLFEALGCSCPVLLAAQGDSADILSESGLGISVPPENSEELLEAFDEMIDRRWSEEQREFAREYVIRNHSRQAAAKTMSSILGKEFA